MKVLVVDDEHDIETLFLQRFRKEVKSGEVELHFAFSGEGALQYLEQDGMADLVLILSDINMPGMNGIELLRRIKETKPHLTVYMITAYHDDTNYQAAMTAGADGYIAKPIDFDGLKVRIHELIERQG
ncbi:MAG: response regulator [Candidatus Hydrogenedentes bacterium]|nr:response regulator [Candidatus Hydrogenedentota bacterium]